MEGDAASQFLRQGGRLLGRGGHMGHEVAEVPGQVPVRRICGRRVVGRGVLRHEDDVGVGRLGQDLLDLGDGGFGCTGEVGHGLERLAGKPGGIKQDRAHRIYG